LNPIEDKTSSILIYQDGAKYLFRLSDLMNIMHTALSHSVNFFVDPLFPKNPYTNQPFTNAMLYAIYFKIRESTYRMPKLFQLFYEVGFDIDRFLYENEAIIRDVYISDYVYKTPSSYLKPQVMMMIRKMNRKQALRIHKDFPVDHLVNIMKPYLYLYYYHMYSISQTDKKYNTMFSLQSKMKKFFDFNPQFGRIFHTMYRNRSGKLVRKTRFNDRCISFQDCLHAEKKDNHEDSETDDNDSTDSDTDDDTSTIDGEVVII
jgi:hypothetical protein